jgi:hypothetical protein
MRRKKDCSSCRWFNLCMNVWDFSHQRDIDKRQARRLKRAGITFYSWCNGYRHSSKQEKEYKKMRIL